MQETQPQDAEFDSFADDYDGALNKGLKISGESKEFFAQSRMRWLRSRLIDCLPVDRALDFGCGTGSATPYFFEELDVGFLQGVDPSLKSVERAEKDWKSYNASFSSTDLEPRGDFDLAFCNGVFHHILPDERDAALQMVHSHLKPGGWFAFWENNPWNPVTRYAMSLVPFDADAVLVWPHQAGKMLKQNGFEVVKTNYLFFFPKCLGRLRVLEPALSWIPLGGQYLVLCRKP